MSGNRNMTAKQKTDIILALVAKREEAEAKKWTLDDYHNVVTTVKPTTAKCTTKTILTDMGITPAKKQPASLNGWKTKVATLESKVESLEAQVKFLMEAIDELTTKK